MKNPCVYNLMGIEHKKEYGVYYWDIFDNIRFLKFETDSKLGALNYVNDNYGNKLCGADRVDIVDSEGNIIATYDIR